MPKEINGRTYYSLPETAKVVGVSHVTVFNWVNRENKGFRIETVIDPMNRRRYISEKSVLELKDRIR